MKQRKNHENELDAIVVGGGLGGLTTAAKLARAGLRVRVYERSREPGGRARTLDKGGFRFNFGAHALYCGGPAMTMLRELGVEPKGRAPKVRSRLVGEDGEHELPTTPLGVLTTSALDLRGKFGLLGLFASLPRRDRAGLEQLSAEAWITREFASPSLRRLMRTLVGLSTYCREPEQLSADAAVEQLRLALGGVLYLDGGWAQLVDGVRRALEDAGGELCLGVRVEGVEQREAGWAVHVDGEVIACDELILAGSPALADGLLAELPGLGGYAERCRPIHACCLELGLRGPWTTPGLGLGLDDPIYLSAHSLTAELAPSEGCTVSLAWYRRERDGSLSADELRARLEAFAARWVPDLRERVVVEQFLPDLRVAHDRPRPGAGLAGRGPSSPARGLHLVGDWIADWPGARSQLLDASLASAERACAAILASPASTRPELRISA